MITVSRLVSNFCLWLLFMKIIINLQIYASDESITGAFFLCFAIRGFYASISKDFQSMGYLKQLYFGSFFGIINAHPFHVETLFFIWSTNYLAVVFTVKFFQLKHFRWIEIINFLEGQIEARNIGNVSFWIDQWYPSITVVINSHRFKQNRWQKTSKNFKMADDSSDYVYNSNHNQYVDYHVLLVLPLHAILWVSNNGFCLHCLSLLFCDQSYCGNLHE